MGRVFRFSVAMVLLAVVVSPVVAGDSIYTPPNVATTSGGGDGGVLTKANARRVLAGRVTEVKKVRKWADRYGSRVPEWRRYQFRVNSDGVVEYRMGYCRRSYRCYSLSPWRMLRRNVSQILDSDGYVLSGFTLSAEGVRYASIDTYERCGWGGDRVCWTETRYNQVLFPWIR